MLCWEKKANALGLRLTLNEEEEKSITSGACLCWDANSGESNLGKGGKVGATFWMWNNCFINICLLLKMSILLTPCVLCTMTARQLEKELTESSLIGAMISVQMFWLWVCSSQLNTWAGSISLLANSTHFSLSEPFPWMESRFFQPVDPGLLASTQTKTESKRSQVGYPATWLTH